MLEPVLIREDLATNIHHELGLSRRDARGMVEDILRHLCAGLTSDRRVKIHGFGTFTVREKAARLGRNPRTGEPAQISARAVLTFRPSAQFRQRVA
jgi:integration host factor subunit alpha